MTEQQSTCESADLDEFLEAVGSEDKAERAARINKEFKPRIAAAGASYIPITITTLPLSSDGPDTIP